MLSKGIKWSIDSVSSLLVKYLLEPILTFSNELNLFFSSYFIRKVKLSLYVLFLFEFVLLISMLFKSGERPLSKGKDSESYLSFNSYISFPYFIFPFPSNFFIL